MAVTTSGLAYEWIGKTADNDQTPHDNADADNATWFGNVGGVDMGLNEFDYTGTDGWVGTGTTGDPYALHSDGTTTSVARTWVNVDANWQSTSFTMEAWICPEAYNASGDGFWFVNHNTNRGLVYYTNHAANNLELQFGNGASEDYYTLVTGYTPAAWGHLVIRYDLATTTLASLWNNAKTTHSAAQAYAANSGSYVYPCWSVSYNHGSVATVRWYTRALSDTEVGNNFTAGILSASTDNALGVTTTAVTDITTTTATSGGTVRNPGAAAITARGVCWNTGGAPTVADSHTTD